MRKKHEIKWLWNWYIAYPFWDMLAWLRWMPKRIICAFAEHAPEYMGFKLLPDTICKRCGQEEYYH